MAIYSAYREYSETSWQFTVYHKNHGICELWQCTVFLEGSTKEHYKNLQYPWMLRNIMPISVCGTLSIAKRHDNFQCTLSISKHRDNLLNIVLRVLRNIMTIYSTLYLEYRETPWQFTLYLGFPAKLVSFRISRNMKRNKFRVSRNKLVVSRNFALKRNKQFRMFRYFLNETKQSISHVS
jgi:hypothetical protein